MKSSLLAGGMFAIALSTSAFAATTMSAAPADGVSVAMYYKATVYDPKENKIGEIDDVILDKSGKVTAFVVGVGGFLGIGEKDVIVPFDAVKVMHRDTTASTRTTTTAKDTAANPPAANPPATTTTTTTTNANTRNTNMANSNAWLAMDETKDSLKAAPGFSYDRTSMTWKPAK